VRHFTTILYENANYKHSYTGIIAAARVADSLNGKIKSTRTPYNIGKLLRHLNTVGFNTGTCTPYTYPDNTAVNEVVGSVKQQILFTILKQLDR
jgi:hypothetical protein